MMRAPPGPPDSAASFGMGLGSLRRPESMPTARGPAPVMLASTSARASDLFFLGVSVLRRGEEGTKPNAFY